MNFSEHVKNSKINNSTKKKKLWDQGFKTIQTCNNRLHTANLFSFVFECSLDSTEYIPGLSLCVWEMVGWLVSFLEDSLLSLWRHFASPPPPERESAYVIMTWPPINMVSGHVWNTNLHDVLYVHTPSSQRFTWQGFVCHLCSKMSRRASVCPWRCINPHDSHSACHHLETMSKCSLAPDFSQRYEK